MAPIKIAVDEHIANRVVFKQLLQAGAADVLTIDACRVAGVNENLAILLLAAKYDVPVCPHAGGVGLCEMVQHLAMFDFVGVAASADDRVLEYVDHLHLPTAFGHLGAASFGQLPVSLIVTAVIGGVSLRGGRGNMIGAASGVILFALFLARIAGGESTAEER